MGCFNPASAAVDEAVATESTRNNGPVNLKVSPTLQAETPIEIDVTQTFGNKTKETRKDSGVHWLPSCFACDGSNNETKNEVGRLFKVAFKESGVKLIIRRCESARKKYLLFVCHRGVPKAKPEQMGNGVVSTSNLRGSTFAFACHSCFSLWVTQCSPSLARLPFRTAVTQRQTLSFHPTGPVLHQCLSQLTRGKRRANMENQLE